MNFNQKTTELILSVDLGTSNLKAAVFDLNGKEIDYESIEFNLYTPENNIVENDANQCWQNLSKIIRKITLRLGERAKNISVIGTSSQGETIIPVDKNGQPLRNAIVWIDSRSKKEADQIRNEFDIVKMYKKTGYPDADPSWPAARILWLRKNQNEIFKNTYKFLLLEDFIIHKLTGMFKGESTVYSSSYYYDIVKYDFIDEILDFVGINRKKLPEILSPGSIVSTINPETARYLGISKRTKVVIGAMDQVCGAMGAGNISKGFVTETTGSAFAMVVTLDKPLFDTKYSLPCIPHAVRGLYALMPYSSTGGMVLKWFKDKFCNEESSIANLRKTSVFKILDEMAKDIPPGSEGLIMLPFITGAFFPEFNPQARGVFFGIGINHNKDHFIRSILESLGYMLKRDIEIMSSLGLKISDIISIGGGASSKLWSQIKADICKKPIKIPEYTESALLGCTILSAVAAGFFNNPENAIKSMVKIKNVYHPESKNGQIYDENFKKYLKLYRKLKGIF